MSEDKLTVGFVRRGYSPTGGAEAYLKRLAEGIIELGHSARLFSTRDWPEDEWPFGELKIIDRRSPTGFADELEKIRPERLCHVLMSLDRIRHCNVYRAGDGVHQAWLNRREKFATPWERWMRKFNPKHDEILRLEKTLLDDRGADCVIANSRMVKDEIVDLYNYRPDKIDIIPNGIPLNHFRFDAELRHRARADLDLKPEHTAVLFVGSGWERKGLRYAIEAVEKAVNRPMLFVAGRGNQNKYQSSRVHFLGEVTDLRPIYSAGDIFVLPTIYDPFSNACLEALACGLPVITTRSNGFSEVIENQIHGSIIDSADDVADLRKAIETWSDPTRRSAARSAIRNRSAQFDISRNVSATLQILLRAARSASS